MYFALHYALKLKYYNLQYIYLTNIYFLCSVLIAPPPKKKHKVGS